MFSILRRKPVPEPTVRKRTDTLDLFVHVPKTGGSCVRTVLGQNYDYDEIRVFDGAFSDFSQFKAGDGTFTDRVRMLYGHVPLGVEHGLGVERIRRITMLRDPISRLVSDYLFATTPDSGYHGAVMDNEMRLLDFADRGTKGMLRNAQSKWIAGYHPLENVNIDDNELYTNAIASLSTYDIVGINEYLPETLLLFAKELRWQPPIFKSVNVSPLSKRFRNMLTQDVVEELSRLNSVDIAVYKVALERFRKIVAGCGPTFWKAVEEIVLANESLDADRSSASRKATFVLGRDQFDVGPIEMPFCRKFISGE